MNSLGATAAASQQVTPHPAASITGVVFDSLLTNAPLSGAEVTIDGTAHSAETDSKGRFSIDGVAAGRAVVRFYHPSLDSLGFGAFALCGVPNDIPFVVRATAGGHVTGLVEVDLSQKLFAVRDLAVSVSDSGSSISQLATLDSSLAVTPCCRPARRSSEESFADPRAASSIEPRSVCSAFRSPCEPAAKEDLRSRGFQPARKSSTFVPSGSRLGA